MTSISSSSSTGDPSPAFNHLAAAEDATIEEAEAIAEVVESVLDDAVNTEPQNLELMAREALKKSRKTLPTIPTAFFMTSSYLAKDRVRYNGTAQ